MATKRFASREERFERVDAIHRVLAGLPGAVTESVLAQVLFEYMRSKGVYSAMISVVEEALLLGRPSEPGGASRWANADDERAAASYYAPCSRVSETLAAEGGEIERRSEWPSAGMVPNRVPGMSRLPAPGTPLVANARLYDPPLDGISYHHQDDHEPRSVQFHLSNGVTVSLALAVRHDGWLGNSVAAWDSAGLTVIDDEDRVTADQFVKILNYASAQEG